MTQEVGRLDKLEALITAGFKDMKCAMKDLKGEMMSVKEDVTKVKETAAENKKELENQGSEITELKDQMKHMISSDQDHRRRAGRR